MAYPDGTLYSYEGAQLSTSSILILLALLTTTAVGFSRLSWVPLILAISAFIGNLGCFLSDPGPFNKSLLYFVRFLAYFGWSLEEWAAPFYSYFLLEAVTRREVDDNVGRWLRRRLFLGGFWSLTILGACARVAMIVMYIVWWHIDTYNYNHNIKYPPGYTHPLIVAIQAFNSIEMILLALTEILTAYGLLVVFRFAVQNSEMYCGGTKVGLFKRMMLSTEIRVGSLAIIGIARTVVNLPKVQLAQPAGTNLSKFMWNAQHLYTMVLLIDLLMCKMASPRFIKRDKTTTGTGTVIIGQSPEGSGGDATMELDMSILSKSLTAPDTREGLDEEKKLSIVTQRSGST